uniref:ribosomal protein S4 n=1 Tax=Meteora sporadica TaxID=2913902 RepID=UPI0030038035|nr:ribosomal protein S4 [Meteora sporadica]
MNKRSKINRKVIYNVEFKTFYKQKKDSIVSLTGKETISFKRVEKPRLAYFKLKNVGCSQEPSFYRSGKEILNSYNTERSTFKKLPHGYNLKNVKYDNLLELQRLKKYYGNISKKKISYYLKNNLNRRATTNKYGNLVLQLETRLQTIVYRMNIASSIYEARQIINHGHVLVNGNKNTSSSYQVRPGDIIELNPKSYKTILTKIKQTLYRHKTIKSNVSTTKVKTYTLTQLPSYLEMNYNTISGTLLYYPKIIEIPYPLKLRRDLRYIEDFFI